MVVVAKATNRRVASKAWRPPAQLDMLASYLVPRSVQALSCQKPLVILLKKYATKHLSRPLHARKTVPAYRSSQLRIHVLGRHKKQLNRTTLARSGHSGGRKDECPRASSRLRVLRLAFAISTGLEQGVPSGPYANHIDDLIDLSLLLSR